MPKRIDRDRGDSNKIDSFVEHFVDLVSRAGVLRIVNAVENNHHMLVDDLSRTGEKEIIDVITNRTHSEGQPQMNGNGRGDTHAERVQAALGSMFMDITCSNCGSIRLNQVVFWVPPKIVGNDGPGGPLRQIRPGGRTLCVLW